MYGLAGIPAIALPFLMQWKGRKLSYILACIFLAIGWSIYLFAKNIACILISESFHGLATNSLLPVTYLSISEMIAPKYRAISMQTFGLSLTFGLATGGIMGRFLHYKTISAIMLVPVCVSIFIAFFWPESPPWFACRGQFDKCEKAFIRLRGTDEESIKELKILVSAQRENPNRRKTSMTLKVFWEEVTSQDFYKPAFHIFVLLTMMYWSGLDFIIIYIIEMVESSAQSTEAAFYASIVVYSIFFVSSIITNITIRKFKNKTVLLSSTCGAILCLICASLVTFLQSVDILSKKSLLCTYFLVTYIASATLGLNAVVFLISAELMPVKHRHIGGASYIIFNCCLYASSLKACSYLVLYIKMYGTFLAFALNGIICSLFVWKYVPETKSRTLQEIEDFYTHGRFIKRKITETNMTNGML